MVKSTDFALCMRHGVHVGNTHLVLHQHFEESQQQAMVGIIVPKKFVKKSSQRHLVKRRLRHLMRERLSTLPLGSRTVLYARGDVDAVSFQDLAAEVDNCLRRALRKLGKEK